MYVFTAVGSLLYRVSVLIFADMNVGGTVLSEASRGSQAGKLQEVLARARNISVYFKNWHISHMLLLRLNESS